MMQMSVSMNDGHSRSWRCQTSLVELVCTDAVVQQRMRKWKHFQGSNVKIRIFDQNKIYTRSDFQSLDFLDFHRKSVPIDQKKNWLDHFWKSSLDFIAAFYTSPFIKINFCGDDSIYFWYQT